MEKPWPQVGEVIDRLDDPEFATAEVRAANGDEINQIVADWTAQLDAADIEARCVAHDVPVATAYDAADPHITARGDLFAIDDPVVGPLNQQAPFPRFGAHPPPTPNRRPPPRPNTPTKSSPPSITSHQTTWPPCEPRASSDQHRLSHPICRGHLLRRSGLNAVRSI